MATAHSALRNRRFALMPTLMLSIGLLVLLAVGSVMVVNWLAERRILQEFATRLITRVLSSEERALRDHLDAAVQQGDFIARAIESDRFTLSDAAFGDFAAGSLAAARR